LYFRVLIPGGKGCNSFFKKNQINLNTKRMKTKFYIFVAILATVFAGITPAIAQYTGTLNDTIYLGSKYKNEVYYSMSAGNKGAVDRNQWDIAFHASRMSASILTNDGLGVELYAYPKSDTSGWAAVDTSGIKSWKVLVNSTKDWETGAFNQHQKAHPDYGWGVYNSVSHDVVGDSLFIIKLRDGSLRKIWIMEKYSSANIIDFRLAKIDGSADTIVSLDCNPYATKNFVGYAISTNQIVDFEPVAATNWDLLFTKYNYTYPSSSPNAGSLYIVTGVLSNYKVKVKEYKQVAPDFILTSPVVMDSTRSPIGWEWKSFNGATFAYNVTDSLAYFVQDRGGKIHKLVFTNFVGSSTGRIAFRKELISFTGVGENPKSGFNAAVYPNPVKEVMNLVINPGNSKLATITLLDMSGRAVLNRKFDLQAEDISTLQIPVSGLPSGIYMLKIQAGVNVIARKIIVTN
jgi:hypothetical protein